MVRCLVQYYVVGRRTENPEPKKLAPIKLAGRYEGGINYKDISQLLLYEEILKWKN